MDQFSYHLTEPTFHVPKHMYVRQTKYPAPGPICRSHFVGASSFWEICKISRPYRCLPLHTAAVGSGDGCRYARTTTTGEIEPATAILDEICVTVVARRFSGGLGSPTWVIAFSRQSREGLFFAIWLVIAGFMYVGRYHKRKWLVCFAVASSSGRRRRWSNVQLTNQYGYVPDGDWIGLMSLVQGDFSVIFRSFFARWSGLRMVYIAVTFIRLVTLLGSTLLIGVFVFLHQLSIVEIIFVKFNEYWNTFQSI